MKGKKPAIAATMPPPPPAKTQVTVVPGVVVTPPPVPSVKLESIVGNAGHTDFMRGTVHFLDPQDVVIGHGVLIAQHIFAPSHVLEEALLQKCHFISVAPSCAALVGTIPPDAVIKRTGVGDWSHFNFAAVNSLNVGSHRLDVPDVKKEVCLQVVTPYKTKTCGLDTYCGYMKSAFSQTSEKKHLVPRVGDCFEHHCDSVAGDCGSLIVQHDKIVGLHVAGSSGLNFFMPVERGLIDYIKGANF